MGQDGRRRLLRRREVRAGGVVAARDDAGVQAVQFAGGVPAGVEPHDRAQCGANDRQPPEDSSSAAWFLATAKPLTSLRAAKEILPPDGIGPSLSGCGEACSSTVRRGRRGRGRGVRGRGATAPVRDFTLASSASARPMTSPGAIALADEVRLEHGLCVRRRWGAGRARRRWARAGP